MHCPFCSADSTQVIDTRPIPDGVRRRRECGDCGERFDRQKLIRGLARAAGGRPVSTDQLESVATWIAEEARRGGPEAEAARIGDLAERGLARVDPVSAIQFASVYRNLADLDELEAVVTRFKDDPLPGEDQLAIDGSVPSGPRSNIGRSRKISSSKRRGHV